MAEPHPAALEAEGDDYGDNDSAVGVESLVSSTTSIGSSILKYRKEHGRTYNAYKVCISSSRQTPSVPIQVSTVLTFEN